MGVWLWIWLVLCACTSDEHPAPVVGTTYRIDKDVQDRKNSELFLDILTTEDACRKAQINDLDACRPFVDRGHGEVHLAFRFLDRVNEQNFAVSLSRDPKQESMLLTHDRSKILDTEVIPHRPRDSGQLYIVLIDGSGSMYENDGERMKQVRRALRLPSVQEAFFPSPDAKTGVMLLTFTDKLHSIDGKEPRILRSRGEYSKMVKEHLGTTPPGYTYLYAAIRSAMTDVMNRKDVQKFLAVRSAQPTIIALTDGFNNEARSDTCQTNVGRLSQTLEVVSKARAEQRGAKAVLYTVGLGERYRQGEKKEKDTRVTSRNLCGQYADITIDGNLENIGIDHYSLAWLAEAGGGVSFVKRDPEGLAEVFLAAAIKRYEWFEIWYRTDPIHQRKSFEVELRLIQGYQASTKVMLHPNPWLDAPTATREPGDVWVTPSSLLRSFTVLMPILGLLIFLNYLPAALFNARRALFRRAKPRK